jgi:putative heme-binding domain-containing protein
VLAGWQERPDQSITLGQHPLNDLLTSELAAHPTDLTLLRLAVLTGRSDAIAVAAKQAFSPETEATRRAALLTLLIPAASAALTDPALALLQTAQPESVQTAALQLAAAANSPQTASRLLQVLHNRSGEPISGRVIDVLLSREAWAVELVQAVDRGQFPATAVSLEQIRRTALFDNQLLQQLVARHWGRLTATTPEARLAEVRRLNNDLRAASGNVESGRALFKKHCAVCHQLFGEGNRIGPELTSANRQDRDFLLVSLVDPSSVIRREYVSLVVTTKDGRIFTGLPATQSDSGLTLLDAKGNRQEIPAEQIETLQDSPVSLMPENLYREFTPGQLRDLFAFLQQ